jgi:hypothetical protein
MIFNYIVTLRNDTGKYVDRLSLLLCSLSAIIFLRQQILTPQKTIVYLIGFLFVAVVVGRNIYLQIVKKHEKVYYNRALFFSAIVWTVMPDMQWLVFVFAFLGLFEFHAKFPLEIGFTENQIVFNSIIKKRYSWNDFNNVVLRDNLLTLDYKNNKIFQKETIDEEGEAEEDEFNDFCQERLKAAAQTSQSSA